MKIPYTNFSDEIYTIPVRTKRKESVIETIATGLMTILLVAIIIGFMIVLQ